MDNTEKSLHNMQHLDFIYLRDITSGDEDIERDLFKIFIENSNKCIERIEGSLKNSNDTEWKNASHELKGSSGSIGAFPLSEILEEAQNSENATNEIKEEILHRIKIEFSALKKYLIVNNIEL